jgi:predicted nucleic acid-binding Zn ribbon protein
VRWLVPIASTCVAVAMSLTPCPGCSREIPDTASTCPHCGQTLQPARERVTGTLLKAYNIGCLIVLALLTLAFLYWLVGVVS